MRDSKSERANWNIILMTEIEKFELLMHGVQALRRHVEYLACPISGASGIRAQFYPHQVQNVQRILSSTRIHHLIADEVGMGKTIQALMIANALRLQAGKLRVRIVVPRAELKNQWIDEIAWRAQCIAELGNETVGDDWFHVIDDTEISKPSEVLATDQFDLLILDEPQSLKQDTLRFVASNSTDFTYLLLLTASPNLRDMRRFLELLQILEPDRIERARRDADDGLLHEDLDWSRSRIGDLHDKALGLVYDMFMRHTLEVVNGQLETNIKPCGVSETYQSFAEYRRIRILAETRWQYRNVLRSYRTDFPDHLPRRRLKRIVIEATSAERDRMQASLKYVGVFLQNHLEPQHRRAASALLQRTSLGGQSLQNRLIQLRRGETEDESQLQMVSELSRREYADSRLDCMVDWLVRFWQDDPTRKVVIAAEDNATVQELSDELTWRIPTVGSRRNRIELKTVLAKDERIGDLSVDETLDSQTLRNFANSRLRSFEESKDQLLIAHNVYRQSYNLQAADALVFYALPWKPEDVDQWIGRVDRLGRDFVDPERPNSRPKPVHILVLHRRGDPTIGVQEVLDEYRIFETAIDPERRLLEQISYDIESRTLPALSESSDILYPLEFDLDDEQDDVTNPIRPSGSKETAAPSGSPWTVPHAVELHFQVSRRFNIGPVLYQTHPLGYVTSPSEEALARWIRLLRNHKWINVSTFPGKKQEGGRRGLTFYTLGQDKSVNIKLDSVQDKNHPFPPFFIARGNIQRPPRTKVETGKDRDGNPRREVLQFLSFGSRVHQDLVETFCTAGRTDQPFGIKIYALGKRHYPNGTELSRGTYLCGVGYIDPAFCYDGFDVNQHLLADTTPAIGTLQGAIRSRTAEKLDAGLCSDSRFIRIQRTAFLNCLAWRWEPGKPVEPCDKQVAADLWGANWRKDERPNTERKYLDSNYLNNLPNFCVTKIAERTKDGWASGMDSFEEAIAERQEILLIEMHDRLWVLEAAIDEIEKEINRRNNDASDANLQAITNNYQPRMKRLQEECELTKRSYEIRIAMLQKSLKHLQSPDKSTVQLQCTAVIEMEYDPIPLPEENDTEAQASQTESELAGITQPEIRK